MNYLFIQSDEDAKKAIKVLEAFTKIVVDTETTGLDSHIAKLRLVQICSADVQDLEEPVFIFDVWALDEEVVGHLMRYIESRDVLVAHNANFDLQFLASRGCNYNNKVFCTYIAERILRAGFKEKRMAPIKKTVYFADVSCGLKAVAERRLDVQISKEEQTSDWGADTFTESQLVYAAKDVKLLPLIAKEQIEELKENDLMPIYSVESRIIVTVARMCRRGFYVDREGLLKLESTLQEEFDYMTRWFVNAIDKRLPEDDKLRRNLDGEIAVGKKIGKEFNASSTKQIVERFLACKVALPIDDTTKKPTLNQIALSEFDSDDELLNHYRKRAKVETKLEHVNKMLTNINPITHRLHSGYNQVGANSGRFTSSGAKRVAKTKEKTQFSVNIQQVPRDKMFRKCLIASAGYKLVICDWAQIELRLIAEMVKIPQMIKAFNNEIDLHTYTASLVYHKSIGEITKEERQDGKTLNFALGYGMGFRKYRTYSAQSGNLISLGEAKVAHRGFHMAYPRLGEWHRERAAMVQDGWCYVRTALGRRRLLAYSDSTMMAAANTPIQGTGADILKLAIANVAPHLNHEAHLVACVHDELVLEVKTDRAEEYREILETTMVQAAQTVLSLVPSVADANIGDTWAEK